MKIILEQIGILSFMTLIGVIAFKLKAINREHANGLVKVIMKITLPLLIFTTFAGTKLNDEIIGNFPYIFASAYFNIFTLFFLSKISSKFLKLDRENSALHSANTMFGNVVFLGFPLLNAIYPGGEGLIYATIFQLSHATLLWTWGIFILNNGSKEKSSKNWKHLLNPNTIAFILGITVLLIKVEIPELIFEPISKIGHTTIYLSMIYVGAVLAGVKLKSLVSNIRSYVLSFNRLLLAPVLLLLAFYLASELGLNISEKAVVTSVMQAAMPCMIIISIIAQEIGLNSKQAVENIFVTSVLSIATLPFMFWLVGVLF